jgi:hypothetical protein
MFELVLSLKDRSGNPINQKRYIKSDNPKDIADFWERHNPESKKNKVVDKNPEWYLDRILKLTKLPAGWDGKYGVPLNTKVAELLGQYLSGSKDLIKSRLNITCTSTGYARIELNSNRHDKNLEIILNTENIIDVVKYDSKTNTNLQYSDTCTSEKFRELVSWFYNG